MPFIRIKKIKGKEYAYLVENSWKKKKKSSRQKSLKYLGRVHKIEKQLNNVLEVNKDSSFNQIVVDLVQNELCNFGFNFNSNLDYYIKNDKSNLFFEDFLVDFSEKSVSNNKKGKAVSLQINEGFLNSYTFGSLLDYKPQGTVSEIGFNLANVFVSAGINLPQDVFVFLYSKLLEENGIENPVMQQLKEQHEDFKKDEFYY